LNNFIRLLLKSCFSLDIDEKIKLIEGYSWQETVPDDGLRNLFETNNKPKHYIGLEISGFLHLGSLLSTGYKVNDFINAGVDCTIFLADWHTIINDKLGGNKENISLVSNYYKNAFEFVCPKAKILMGSEFYEKEGISYWEDLVKFTKHTTLARIRKTLTIMGRNEGDEKIDLAKMLYPPMQAIDIHSLDVDIAHAGMDQRKIHMLVRDIFPKLDWKVPISVHHKILPSLIQSRNIDDNSIVVDKPTKMSKSNPKSGIFINDSDKEIQNKIRKSWCELGKVHDTPLIDIMEQIIFHQFNKVEIEQYGTDKILTYDHFPTFIHDVEQDKIHPGDLKDAVSKYLIKIISPIREKLNLDPITEDVIKRSVKP